MVLSQLPIRQVVTQQPIERGILHQKLVRYVINDLLIRVEGIDGLTDASNASWHLYQFIGLVYRGPAVDLGKLIELNCEHIIVEVYLKDVDLSVLILVICRVFGVAHTKWDWFLFVLMFLIEQVFFADADFHFELGVNYYEVAKDVPRSTHLTVDVLMTWET